MIYRSHMQTIQKRGKSPYWWRMHLCFQRVLHRLYNPNNCWWWSRKESMTMGFVGLVKKPLGSKMKRKGGVWTYA